MRDGGTDEDFTLWNVEYVPYQSVPMILPQVHLRKPCYDFSFL